MNIVLFDTVENRTQLLPLSYTRSVADMRIGILTIKEKWERYFGQSVGVLTEDYLQPKYGALSHDIETLFIASNVFPNAQLVAEIQLLTTESGFTFSDKIIAFKTTIKVTNIASFKSIIPDLKFTSSVVVAQFVESPSAIFKYNGQEIENDFKLLTAGRVSKSLSPTNTLIGPADKLFIEEDAVVEASILNTNTGYIYIGHEAEIMENCAVRGPLALCEHAGLKMSAKIYGATTIGPHCKVGGEVNNAVFFAYSNKGHDGFIGNSVIGEWCNLGADTNNSNLKNNYGDVDVWSYVTEKYEDTGMQFHGLIMGDHAKSGINTMFNTGSVVGVSANVFGSDFPPKFIPSFSWGGAQWLRTFTFEKALEVAERMMERRGIKLSESDIAILKEVFERDKKYRK
ncbi:MAG: GlmU family protein [Chitinophagales bacterium]|nr:GlmU family protein [Chitinophagales bacterium]